jgi:hypothetical protein
MKQDAEAYSSNGIGAGQFNGSSGKYGLSTLLVAGHAVKVSCAG